MKTYYFISFDNGFMRFAKVTVEHCISADVAHHMLVQECPIMWVSVSEEEYMQLLYNE